jgi:hypothetical protein
MTDLPRPKSDPDQDTRTTDPAAASGALVKVAHAHDQVDAEFLQALLLEQGVPSLLRRTPGFDVPDFLAAGPRDVLVPGSGAQVARDVLLEADVGPAVPASGAVQQPSRVLAGVLIAAAVAAFIVCLGTDVLA